MLDNITSAIINSQAAYNSAVKPTPVIQENASVSVIKSDNTQNSDLSFPKRSNTQPEDFGQNKKDKTDQVKEINDELHAWNTNIQFKIDEDTKSLVISIIDKDTGKEVKQIPSEATLRIAKMISDFQGKNINTEV